MNNLLKRQTYSVLKWAFANFTQNNLTPSKTTIKGTGFSYITQNPRFYGRKAHIQSHDLIKDNSVIEVQDALIEYLHSTRNLQYVDAENISRNSPNFLGKLLKSVENEKDAKQSLRRLFCYQPINEFEPFFESMGMKPCEYSSLLPRDMMYLADDQRLLANYHVLCEYGVSPNKIGKIYIEAHEVFGYDHGLLLSKLNSLQAWGFTQSGVAKLVSSCPNVLGNDDFLKVLEALTNVGIVHSWFEENILEENSYDWSKILEHLCLIKGLCCSNEDLKELLYNNSTILLEDSGDTAISLIVFMIKFGASIDTFLRFLSNSHKSRFEYFSRI